MGSFLSLLYPHWQSWKRRLRFRTGREVIKPALFTAMGIGFWFATFLTFYRVLAYFQSIESLGDFLAAKLLSMVFLVFFSILVFSNIITSLSTFFLSEELPLLFSFPVSLRDVFTAKFVETIVNSSWMVFLFGIPVFLAYGLVYHAPLIFYGMCMVAFLPYLAIASSLGVMVTMGLVAIFPARRTRDILILLSIVFIGAIYLLFRFLKPESLVDPDIFASLLDYLTNMGAVSSPLLPSHWATESLLPLLQPFHRGESVFYLLMLWSTSLALFVISNEVALRIYFRGWSKSQESKRLRLSRSGVFNRIIAVCTRPFSPAIGGMIEKDIKVFFRDPTQWSQLLLLVSLVIVYLYNFKVLPLDKSPLPTFYLQNLFSFLNLGLAGFVLAAIAVRFVFPAVSMEGQSFWIIRSSPFPLKQFLCTKFWMALIPLLVLGETLTFFSNLLLKVSDFMMVLSLTTIIFMTFGITSLGIGMGAMYPRFKHGNTAEISSGFGGLLYMMFAVGLIGITVVLEARPVYFFFMAQIRKFPLTGWFFGEMAVAITFIILLHAASLIIPLRYGLESLTRMEKIV